MKTYLICSIQKDESEEPSWVGLSWLLVIPKLLATFEAYITSFCVVAPCTAPQTFIFLSVYLLVLVQIERITLPYGEAAAAAADEKRIPQMLTHTHALQLIQLMAYS